MAANEPATSDSPGPMYVRAKHSFKGKNNDELCFIKGDVIIITQKLDGGWWEGTLGDHTAWFPSNYVAEINANERHLRSKSPGNSLLMNNNNNNNNKGTGADGSAANSSNKTAYRHIVLKDLIEAEARHVKELQMLFANFLLPLKTNRILSAKEYERLVGNLESVISHQTDLLQSLEQSTIQNSLQQRVGGEFIKRAPVLSKLLKKYSENHPLAINVLNQHFDKINEFIEKEGGDRKTLITGLSQPFRHLQKYPATLQELERNMDESHADRGDTQRAISVYRNILNDCNESRRQKEMQLELVSSGLLRGWNADEQGGSSIESLGDVLLMDSAPVVFLSSSFAAAGKDVSAAEIPPPLVDATLLLFPQDLLLLESSKDFNSYIFKLRFRLEGTVVHRLNLPSDNSSNSSAAAAVASVKSPTSPKSPGTGTSNSSNTAGMIVKLANNQSQQQLKIHFGPSPNGLEDGQKWLDILQTINGVAIDPSCHHQQPVSGESDQQQQQQVAPQPMDTTTTTPSQQLPTSSATGGGGLPKSSTYPSNQHNTGDTNQSATVDTSSNVYTRAKNNTTAIGGAAAGINHDVGMIDPDVFNNAAKRLPTPTTTNQTAAAAMSMSSMMRGPSMPAKPLPPPPLYSGYSLRPYPAPRGQFAVDPSKNDIKLRKRANQINDQEDAQILKVVEAYCTSAMMKSSAYVDSPQLLVAEDEKIIVEERVGDEIVIQEKSLVDTVYALKDQMNTIQEEMQSMRRLIERESRARRRLEDIFRKSSQPPSQHQQSSAVPS